ncbi:MAG: glycosyltransferase family 2 protein [Anaerolineales bacterium]|nr:MAG: glycosyltransferase family 2 protein [Anaerolineales bacterium]
MADEKYPNLSVVLPAYNEAGSVGSLLTELLKHLRESKLSFEAILVDDGSQDNTAEKAGALKAEFPELTVIRHPYNKGNGSAIKTGLRAARGRAVVCMDSDGQHNFRELLRLYEHIGEYDLVVGARTQSYQSQPVRKFGNWVFNQLARTLTQFPIQDLTSGFRAFRREAIAPYIDLLPARFSYPTTSTLIFLKAGYNVKYVPVDMLPRSQGSSKIKVVRDGWRFFVIILKIAVLFEPLQIFLPVAMLFLLMALASTAYASLAVDRLFIPNSGSLFFSISVLVFLLGLVAEQITNLQIASSKNGR